MRYVMSEHDRALKEKCEKLHIVSWDTARGRLRAGWDEEDAIRKPSFYGKHMHNDFYVRNKMTIDEYCAVHNIKNVALFKSRLARGFDEKTASIPAWEGRFCHKGKKAKHYVILDGERKPFAQAFRELCAECGVTYGIKSKSAVIFVRMKKTGQTLQQSFNHYVRLYRRKYKGEEV